MISTTATESTAAYSSGTTYAIGNKVKYGNYLYESLTNSNVGNQPDISPTLWLKTGPTNPFAMFDSTISTQTTATTSLVVVIKPNQICNSVAFLNLSGTSLRIVANDGVGGPVIYDKTVSMDGSVISSWYDYFFEPFDIRNAIVFTDIPIYANVVFTLTITGTSCKIGNFVYGNVITIGSTQMGVGLGIIDYSVKESDAYGNTTFVQRAYSKRMEPSVYVENTRLRYVNKTLEEIRAIPTVWIGSEDEMYDPLVIYGFFKDYSISISYPSVSMLSLTIEGLI